MHKYSQESTMFAPHIIWLDSATSTNSELSHIIAQKRPEEWTIIAARSQTSGRGQAGNRWEAAPGMNICCSICLYPQSVEPADQFVISMAVAVGIARYLHEKSMPVKIKWPNDIYIQNKKICGILIENQLMGEEICSSVIGIGLNVNQTEFGEDIPNPTSLKLETGLSFSIETELLLMTQHIHRAVSQIYRGEVDQIMQAYHNNLYLRGVEHRFYEKSRPIDGIISQVAKSGGMTVILSLSGEQKTYFFKEISYSPME